MKKCFLAVITALSLAGFSYAQDDEYEEEEVVYEEEAPAPKASAPKKQEVVYVEEDEEDEAPAKPAKKASKPRPAGMPFVGVGVDVGGLLNQNANINVTFKLNEAMELTAILGMWHRGETTVTAGGVDQKQKDNYTELSIGVGFDYYLNAGSLLPFSIGGELIYNAPQTENADDDAMNLQINVLVGAHAELVKNLYLNGKVGLAMDYISYDTPATESSRLDLGLATKVYLTWFIF